MAPSAIQNPRIILFQPTDLYFGKNVLEHDKPDIVKRLPVIIKARWKRIDRSFVVRQYQTTSFPAIPATPFQGWYIPLCTSTIIHVHIGCHAPYIVSKNQGFHSTSFTRTPAVVCEIQLGKGLECIIRADSIGLFRKRANTHDMSLFRYLLVFHLLQPYNAPLTRSSETSLREPSTHPTSPSAQAKSTQTPSHISLLGTL